MSMTEEIKGAIMKMFKTTSASGIIGKQPAISNEMDSALKLWCLLYKNRGPHLSKTVKSANMASAIASEIARLVTIEIKSEVTGSERAKFLNRQYQNIQPDIRKNTEYACAKGGIVMKPYVEGKSIYVDFIQADSFYPTGFNSNGNMTGAVFISQKTEGNTYYTRLEQHEMTDSGCLIKNRAFKSNSESDIGREIPLSSVPEWADVASEALISGVKKPLFAYFKIPFANNIDPTSPLGVSVFARAVDIIAEVDRQYSRLLWEYEGSELAVDADVTLFKKDKNGRFILPSGRERLFRTMDLDGESKYNVFSPAIRDESLLRGLDKLLQRVEFNCGLAYGTLSDPQTVERTAEEIRASKQRSYNMVADIQKSLKYALIDLVAAMDVWATVANLSPEGKHYMSFEFDDSTVADRKAEFEEKSHLVEKGIMSPWEFRMWYFGEDEHTARSMVKGESGNLKGESGNLKGEN